MRQPDNGVDWNLVAQTAIQQRDRANQIAANLEIDLILARAKIEALETAAEPPAAAEI